jgi:hypothetical protein
VSTTAKYRRWVPAVFVFFIHNLYYCEHFVAAVVDGLVHVAVDFQIQLDFRPHHRVVEALHELVGPAIIRDKAQFLRVSK